jgi:beta-lactamase regulating signal transducer with metallopeptidase domain
MDSLVNAATGFAAALAAALLHSLWQCALLALAAAAALNALARRSAALRHVVGMGFLLAMISMPMLSFVQFWARAAGAPGDGAPLAAVAQRADAALGVFGPHPNGWAAALSTLWLLGVAAMLIRHMGGMWWIGRLERRGFQPLPTQWQEHLDELQRVMGITRKIAVRVAEDIVMPFTARLVRPIIWIPIVLLTRLPREQVEALLAHELAHIRRLDWLWNGVQCLIEALLFFHPGVWWLNRRIREERERACDELAVKACADPVVLAEALTALARDQQSGPRLVLAVHGSPLLERIKYLLTGAPAPTRTWAPLGLVALLAVSAVLVAPLATGYATLSNITAQARDVSGGFQDRVNSARVATPAPPASHAAVRVRVAAVSPFSAAVAPASAAVSPVNELVAPLSAARADQTSRQAEQAARDAELAAQLGDEKAVRDSELAAQLREEKAARDAELAAQLRTEDAMHRAERTARVAARTPALPQPIVRPGDLLDFDQAMPAIVRLVAADPSVASKLGTPVAMTPKIFTGRWGTNSEGNGDVRGSFTLTGPKGQAAVSVSAIAMRDDMQWRLTRLEVSDFEPAR